MSLRYFLLLLAALSCVTLYAFMHLATQNKECIAQQRLQPAGGTAAESNGNAETVEQQQQQQEVKEQQQQQKDEEEKQNTKPEIHTRRTLTADEEIALQIQREGSQKDHIEAKLKEIYATSRDEIQFSDDVGEDKCEGSINLVYQFPVLISKKQVDALDMGTVTHDKAPLPILTLLLLFPSFVFIVMFGFLCC